MRKILLLAGFLCFLYSGYSQEYSYRFYSVSDGLPQTQITYLFQDSKGFIWIGTKGGLCRFDGMEFDDFGLEDGLTSRIICNISEGSDGKIYVLCDHGFSVFDGTGFKAYPFPDHIRVYMNNNSVAHGINGNIFISGNVSKKWYLLKFSKDKYTDARIDFVLPDTIKVNDIIFDDNDSTYILGTLNSGIYVCKNNNSLNILSNLRGVHLVNKQAGQLIFTGRYENSKVGKLYRISLSDKDNVFTIMDSINKPTLYLGKNHFFSSGFGGKYFKEYDNGKIIKFHKQFLRPNATLLDREGNLWIGTEIGLYRLQSRAFLNYTEKSGINDYVWSIVEDRKGDILFASFLDGLAIYYGKSFKKYDKSFFHKGFYRGAILSRSRNVLLPTSWGITIYDGKSFKRMENIPHTPVLYLYEDTVRNRLLISSSTYGLLIREKDGKVRKYKISPGPINEYISTINMDTLGRYWIGGFYGMTIIEGDSLIKLPTDEFPYGKGAIASYRDSHGNLWFGTTSGLYLYDYKHFRKVGGDQIKTYIMSLAGMAGNKLFIGMVKGMGILDLNSFYSRGKEDIMLFDHTNGFLGEECKQNGVYTDSKGYTWVATSDRVVRVDPGRIKNNSSKPLIYIKSVRTLSGERDTVVKLPLDTVSRLRWFQKDLQFDYHALYLKVPERVRYAYKLKGYDKEWSQPTKARYAHYTNLKPGTYEFLVKACNENGVWSENPASFTFSIIPAFWQTQSFLILMNVITLLLAGYIIRDILKRKRRKKEERDTIDKQLAEMKLLTIRNQMDPHFTFNAINSLGTLIYTEAKEDAYDYLVKFSDLIRKTLESSNNIAQPLERELDFVREYLDLQKYRFKNKFEYSIHIDSDIDLQVLIPRMIIETHVENSLKHGLIHLDKKGLIKVEVTKEDGDLVIKITDNGIGRQRSRKYGSNSTRIGLKVTEQFYTLINKYNKEKITRQIIDLYDVSGNPAGTKVIIRIPEGMGYQL